MNKRLRMSPYRFSLVQLLLLALAGCPGEVAPPAPGVASANEAASTQAAAEPAEDSPAEPVKEPPAEPQTQSPAEATPSAAPVGVEGTITHNGQTMQIVGGVAVWDPAKSLVKLTLLPFEPTPEEVEQIRQDRAFGVIFAREKGVQGFADRTPHATFSVGWQFAAADAGDLEKAGCHLYVGFLAEQNSNMNLSWPHGQSHELTLEGPLETGSQLTLTTKGEDSVFDETTSWDFRFSGPIQATIADAE
jgi:hypothetical protein